MNAKQYCQLWETRFKKVLNSEQTAYEFYKALIRKFSLLLGRTGIKEKLEEIAKDEEMHIQVARELMDVMKRAAARVKKEKT